MRFDFDLFLRALGLAVVLEGLCWALFPRGMRRALRELLAQPDVDGGLIGGASLKADQFAVIVDAATKG